MKSINVLSTKKLSSEQLRLFDNSQISIDAYSAISIEKLPFIATNQVENAIVTSQNSAQIIIDAGIQVNNVFCVGKKTSKLILKNSINVVKTASNAADLANFIVKKHKNDSFVFFCGNIRRDELPNILTKNEIDFTEKLIYKTSSNFQKINKNFDGILFFSPSGVQSYIQENSLTNSVVFCIGKTTASEVRKHTSNIVVAQQSTVENTITTAIDYFKS